MSASADETRRFTERLYPHYAQQMTRAGASLVESRSAFQTVEVFDTPLNGRVLALDGIVQMTTRDEAHYAEMLSHVPILEHGAVRRVLIVGGGDFSIAEECLKHASVTDVDVAEIDPLVIEASRRHLGSVNAAAFADPRLHIHVVDAARFLAQETSPGHYDLVISDRPDPVGPAGVLFEGGFYASIARALSTRGIAVFQTGVPFYQPAELSADIRALSEAFPHAGVYLTVVPTYVGGFMALTWGAKGERLGTPGGLAAARARFAAAPFPTDYYTPDMHAAAFALPRFIARLVSG